MLSAEDAAIAATISLLLEVSASPKSGNVDRDHDFEDLKFEDFLISSAAAFPSFLRAAESKKIGENIFYAVKTSSRWQRAGNVHFGAFLLLIPLLTGWEGRRGKEVAKIASENVKRTTSDDSIYVFKAFKICKARVLEVEKFSLKDDKTKNFIVEKNLNLYNWMLLAPKDNLIAKELTEGFKISLKASEKLFNYKNKKEAIVYTFHELLASYLDPLILAKFGYEKAVEIKIKASEALKEGIEGFKKLDQELLNIKANPGTIADITASAIFLAICDGWLYA
ncbi:MAG: triphosphoribosyl-dephospho-CoA synthase [Archaeoglobaceae archaeon]|nr:triphosphoribosyl-dephospho-CoA synthase [Archaeoglobaceae archaeon]MCX8151834.1 triphosphoribosyl-dephospho-CoA synthase [Archaeoglobaceae archaeon]MDW8014334.1 triphosphoribosyl-dephospho-CoA synthase [Archaeoglobaceae archaeon]